MLNLDAMTQNELNSLHTEIYKHIRLSAKKYGYSVRDIRHIKDYAINKVIAMGLRKAGRIERARQYESICENIYSYLSESAKW